MQYPSISSFILVIMIPNVDNICAQIIIKKFLTFKKPSVIKLSWYRNTGQYCFSNSYIYLKLLLYQFIGMVFMSMSHCFCTWIWSLSKLASHHMRRVRHVTYVAYVTSCTSCAARYAHHMRHVCHVACVMCVASYKLQNDGSYRI